MTSALPSPSSTAPTPPRTTTGVAIIGGGPIGLSLAVACRRQQIPFQLIEAGQLGQTISWWAPQTRWFSSNERISIAGVPLQTIDQSKATREQYLTYLRAIAKQYRIAIRAFEQAREFRSSPRGWTVITARNAMRCEIDARAVVLAIGGTDHPRRLGIAGEELPHVDSYLREPHRYFGRRVLIIGGRNSAVEAALRLHHAGAQVAISYRGAALPQASIKYWLWPELDGLLRSGAIESHLGTEAVRITPAAVELRPTGGGTDGSTYQAAADDVLSLIGYEQDKTLFQQAGVTLTEPGGRPRFDEETMETNVAGIYVAGTAVGGTQTSQYKVFLENCHAHITRILAHLQATQPALCAPEATPSDAHEAASLAAQIEARPES